MVREVCAAALASNSTAFLAAAAQDVASLGLIRAPLKQSMTPTAFEIASRVGDVLHCVGSLFTLVEEPVDLLAAQLAGPGITHGIEAQGG